MSTNMPQLPVTLRIAHVVNPCCFPVCTGRGHIRRSIRVGPWDQCPVRDTLGVECSMWIVMKPFHREPIRSPLSWQVLIWYIGCMKQGSKVKDGMMGVVWRYTVKPEFPQQQQHNFHFHGWISWCSLESAHDLRKIVFQRTRASARIWLTCLWFFCVHVLLDVKTPAERALSLSLPPSPAPSLSYILAHHSQSISYRVPTNPRALSELERRQQTE